MVRVEIVSQLHECNNAPKDHDMAKQTCDHMHCGLLTMNSEE